MAPTVASTRRSTPRTTGAPTGDRAAGRPELIVLENASVLVHQEILCWDDERPLCVKARETIAAARAKGIR